MKRAVIALLFLAACEQVSGGNDTRDVSGNYELTYDNQLKLTLDIAGARREATATGYGGIVDFGTYNGQPVTLDLTAFCAKNEVQCPNEAFWPKVAINQPNLSANKFLLQTLAVIDNTVHALDAGLKAPAVAGLVDNGNFDRFVLGLGASGASGANCLAYSLSLASGRFTRAGEKLEDVVVYQTPAGKSCSPDAGVLDAGPSDAGAADAGTTACNALTTKKLVIPKGASVNGIGDGKILLGWGGGCAFGPFLAGATLVIETGYTGKRTGAFDPPPYTQPPVVLPDGGLDAGTADGG